MTLEEKVDLLFKLLKVENQVAKKLIVYLRNNIELICSHRNKLSLDEIFVHNFELLGTSSFKLDEDNDICIEYYINGDYDTDYVYILKDNEYYDKLLELYNKIVNTETVGKNDNDR